MSIRHLFHKIKRVLGTWGISYHLNCSFGHPPFTLFTPLVDVYRCLNKQLYSNHFQKWKKTPKQLGYFWIPGSALSSHWATKSLRLKPHELPHQLHRLSSDMRGHLRFTPGIWSWVWHVGVYVQKYAYLYLYTVYCICIHTYVLTYIHECSTFSDLDYAMDMCWSSNFTSDRCDLHWAETHPNLGHQFTYEDSYILPTPIGMDPGSVFDPIQDSSHWFGDVILIRISVNPNYVW